MKLPHLLLPLVCLIVGAPVRSFAQQGPDAPDTARFHLGRLALTPKLGIQNLGVDTNVFNASETPVKDGTATITPGLDAWLRVGRLLFTNKATTDLIYFQKTASQRSLNVGDDWRVDVDLLRAAPRLTGTFVRTRQRPNDELDARVQQKRVGGGVGVTVPVGSRLKFDLDARRARLDYSQGEFGDSTVAVALNRDTDQVNVAARVELTPLTTFVIQAESSRDRFAFTPDRNSDSVRIMPGVIFQPFALVSGSAFVGVRRFTTLSAAVPDYTGVVAAVELKYVARDVFRITGQVKRDVDYSLDLTEPFFVSTTVGAEVTQVLGLDWDVMGRFRRGSLAYQQTSPGVPGRTDHVSLVGVGIGRRLGEQLRIGFDVDYVTRTSAVATRTFDGLRFGGSLTYGY